MIPFPVAENLIWQHVLDTEHPPTDDFKVELMPNPQEWQKSAGVPGFHGSSYHYTNLQNAYALYELHVPKPDYYEVLVRTAPPACVVSSEVVTFSCATSKVHPPPRLPPRALLLRTATATCPCDSSAVDLDGIRESCENRCCVSDDRSPPKLGAQSDPHCDGRPDDATGGSGRNAVYWRLLLVRGHRDRQAGENGAAPLHPAPDPPRPLRLAQGFHDRVTLGHCHSNE